jgi:16S rRNA (guanine966-N2)-methyltransferase
VAVLDEGARARIVPGDATRPPRAALQCTVVFIDPPYRSGLAAPALEALDRAGWLSPDALAIVELGTREELAVPDAFTLLDQRVYGAARLVFLRRKDGPL